MVCCRSHRGLVLVRDVTPYERSASFGIVRASTRCQLSLVVFSMLVITLFVIMNTYPLPPNNGSRILTTPMKVLQLLPSVNTGYSIVTSPTNLRGLSVTTSSPTPHLCVSTSYQVGGVNRANSSLPHPSLDAIYQSWSTTVAKASDAIRIATESAESQQPTLELQRTAQLFQQHIRGPDGYLNRASHSRLAVAAALLHHGGRVPRACKDSNPITPLCGWGAYSADVISLAATTSAFASIGLEGVVMMVGTSMHRTTLAQVLFVEGGTQLLTIVTRSENFDVARRSVIAVHTRSRYDPTHGVVMYPVLDMINHQSKGGDTEEITNATCTATATLTEEGEDVCLAADVPATKACKGTLQAEVVMDYQLSPEDLFVTHGVLHRPLEWVEIATSPPKQWASGDPVDAGHLIRVTDRVPPTLTTRRKWVHRTASAVLRAMCPRGFEERINPTAHDGASPCKTHAAARHLHLPPPAVRSTIPLSTVLSAIAKLADGSTTDSVEAEESNSPTAPTAHDNGPIHLPPTCNYVPPITSTTMTHKPTLVYIMAALSASRFMERSIRNTSCPPYLPPSPFATLTASAAAVHAHIADCLEAIVMTAVWGPNITMER